MSARDRDDERRKFHGDVDYLMWRLGAGYPDYDRVEDGYWRGDSAEDVAAGEIRRARRRREERLDREAEEGW